MKFEITDDAGYHWYWTENLGKVRCVEAENELREKFVEDPSDENREALQDNGYYVNNWGRAILLLMQLGYIDIDPYKIEPQPKL